MNDGDHQADATYVTLTPTGPEALRAAELARELLTTRLEVTGNDASAFSAAVTRVANEIAPDDALMVAAVLAAQVFLTARVASSAALELAHDPRLGDIPDEDKDIAEMARIMCRRIIASDVANGRTFE